MTLNCPKELFSCESSIHNSIDILINALKHNKHVYVCGNGGSAADALHFVGELQKSFMVNRPLQQNLEKKLYQYEDGEFLVKNLQQGLPVHSLVGEVALITAIANDQSGDLIFAQQIVSCCSEGDVLIAISTSGNSKNIVYACEVAKAKGMKIVGLTGNKLDSKLSTYADVLISAPSNITYEIQEYHLPIYHYICQSLEQYFFNEKCKR